MDARVCGRAIGRTHGDAARVVKDVPSELPYEIAEYIEDDYTSALENIQAVVASTGHGHRIVQAAFARIDTAEATIDTIKAGKRHHQEFSASSTNSCSKLEATTSTG